MYHKVRAIWANGMAMEVTVWAQGQATANTAIDRFKEVMEARGVDFSGAPFPERFEISYPIPDGSHSEKRQLAMMSFQQEFNVFVHISDREGVEGILDGVVSDYQYTQLVDAMMEDAFGMTDEGEGDFVRRVWREI
jgi:hypothetical protein